MTRRDTRGLPRPDARPELDTRQLSNDQILENTLIPDAADVSTRDRSA